MTARSKLRRRILDTPHEPGRGWSRLVYGDRKDVFYRWTAPPVREELCVLYDKAGRVEAWTVWESRRTWGPDQNAGRKDRLIEFAELSVEP